jgi:hypothetical protein
LIITLSRQFGAGGAEVAKRVADRLQWRVADNEFVDRVAARAGLTPDEVAVREERVPNFLERLAWALASASAELAVPTGDDGRAEELLMVRVTRAWWRRSRGKAGWYWWGGVQPRSWGSRSGRCT